MAISAAGSQIRTIDSMDLASYILAKLGPMTHLKLQKLVYYCEAYHLAYFEQSLIKDPFQAWVHGPVSVKLWVALKDKANIYDGLKVKADATPGIVKKTKETLSKDQFEMINDLLKEFGKKTSYELECLTHEEEPWIEARKGTPPNEKSKAVLSKKTMEKYYKKKMFA